MSNSRFSELRDGDQPCGGMYACINTTFRQCNPLCRECLMDTEQALKQTEVNTDELAKTQNDCVQEDT